MEPSPCLPWQIPLCLSLPTGTVRTASKKGGKVEIVALRGPCDGPIQVHLTASPRINLTVIRLPTPNAPWPRHPVPGLVPCLLKDCRGVASKMGPGGNCFPVPSAHPRATRSRGPTLVLTRVPTIPPVQPSYRTLPHAHKPQPRPLRGPDRGGYAPAPVRPDPGRRPRPLLSPLLSASSASSQPFSHSLTTRRFLSSFPILIWCYSIVPLPGVG